MSRVRAPLCVGALLGALSLPAPAEAKARVGAFDADPKVWRLEEGDLRARGGNSWSYALLARDVPADAALEAEVTVTEPCKRQGPGQADWFRYTVQRDD